MDASIAKSHHEIAKTLARRFLDRNNSAGHVGRKRANDAIHYFCGAAVAAHKHGDAELCELLTGIAAEIESRGVVFVMDMARFPDRALQPVLPLE